MSANQALRPHPARDADRARHFVPASVVAPQLRNDYVNRPTLQALTHRVANSRLTTVCAPAGYGKTAVALHWFNELKTAGRPGLWIAARAGIADLDAFLFALGEASTAAGMPWAAANPQRCEASWLAALSVQRDRKPVLVVDDAQLLPDDAVRFLRRMIVSARDAITTILVSRGPVDIPLARSRALGYLVEVSSNELSFNSSEAAELLARIAGVTPQSDRVERLLEDTRGWPAGLVIAANRYRCRSDDEAGRKRFDDSLHAAFSSFFNEEVLALQPPEVREFLIDTSILEELTPSACAAITGDSRESAEKKLDAVLRAGLFVFPVDWQRSCLAYHPLFRQTVSKELIHGRPARAAELHRRASRYFAESGEFLAAIEHAKFCSDPQFLAAQLDCLANELISRGYLYRIDELSSELPWSAVSSRPMLLLALAWRRIRRLSFVAAERLIEAAAQIARSRPGDSRLECLLHHRRVMLEAARDNMTFVEQEAPQLLYQLGDEEPYLSCSLIAQLMSARRELYHFHDMLKLEAETRRALESPRTHFASIALKSTVAPTLAVQGKTAQARRFLEEALALAESQQGKGSGLAAVPGLPLAELVYDLGELELAADLVNRYLPVVRVWGFVDQLASGYLVYARLAVARGDLTAALSSLEEAHLVAIECGLERLRTLVVAEQVRILVKSGMPSAAKAALRAVGISSRAIPLPTAKSKRKDESIALAWLRVEMYGQRLAGAEKVAASWLEFLQRAGAVRSIVIFQLLAAEIAVLRGNRSKARRAVRKALELAAPSAWSQIFLDEGEVICSLIKEAYTVDPSHEMMPADWLAARIVALIRGSPEVAADSTQGETACLTSNVSAREVSILTMVSSGLRNREIGERLGLTEGTVKWYLQQVYDRLGVRRRTQAVIRARHCGILK